MTITEFVQIGTFLLAILATTISLKTFSRNRKLELENHLFKIKLEAFSNIAFEIDNFFIILNRAIVRIHQIPKEPSDNLGNELNNLSFDIDEQIYKCHSLIVKYSIYFSVRSIERLLAFTDNLLGDVANASNEGFNMMKWIDDYYSNQVTLSNSAIEELRSEMQLEKLHNSLYRRSSN